MRPDSFWVAIKFCHLKYGHHLFPSTLCQRGCRWPSIRSLSFPTLDPRNAPQLKKRVKKKILSRRIARPASSRGWRARDWSSKEREGGGRDMGDGRSLAETPTWSVATLTTVMVAVCFVVERSIYRFGKVLVVSLSLSVLYSSQEDHFSIYCSFIVMRSCAPQWLRKTKRKAMVAALEKIREGDCIKFRGFSILIP